MTPFDLLMIIFGVGIVIFGAYQRMLRTLFMLIVIWLAAFLGALAYEYVTVPVQALAPNNPTAVKGMVFLVLFLLFTIAGYVISRLAFPITKLPKIGFLDVLAGGLIGIVVAAVMLSLIFNTLGFIVSERWETQTTTWISLRSQFLSARLLSYVQQVMNVYARTFTPFFRDLPPVLIPR
jgi:uncharacterized membrane protein required for colicin V production